MIDTHFSDTRAARAQIAVCSFDVFDTFLLRRCTTPEGVFERAFELSPVSRSHPHAMASYVQHRIHAEGRARRAAKQQRDTVEAHIDEIYAYFPFRLFGLDRSALRDLVAAEFVAEIDLCRVNHDILRLYRAAQRKGQRVGFISDTYWSETQLARLLTSCCPDLTWDFLYASCAHDTGKSDKLFARYITGQGIDPAAAMHIGDNQAADIKGARDHGIKARYYPQASAAFAAQLQRESATYELLCDHPSARLDQGARTLRRLVAAQTPERSPAYQLGVGTLGPVMAAFDAFVADRAARLRDSGATTVIAFLGRDGFLSHRVWQTLHGATAAYVEINRRVSLIGSAAKLSPLIDLLSKINRIDAATFGDIVKVLPQPVATFFSRFPGGIASGAALAEALPRLIAPNQVADVAAAMRKALLTYLRLTIPDFDACTDLVLADLGYSGSVQKALRQIFDHEGIGIRIHGAYLLTIDDAFDDLAGHDTAEGLISDLVVTPHVKRMIVRNVALLEQLCSAPEGSVRDYRDGDVLREVNPRPHHQLVLAAEVQEGALAFITRAMALGPKYGMTPFTATETAARWTAATLARLLLLPDDDELMLLGPLQHDVNLGTQALAPMIDSDLIRNLTVARGLHVACAANAPPMWLAGSFASLSPSHSYLYMLFGANRLPPNVFGEAKCGALQIGLFGADGAATMQTVSCYRTGFGDLRLRIPVARMMQVTTIAVPLARIARAGLLHGVTVQTGPTIKDATLNPDVVGLSDDRLTVAGLTRAGKHYQADDHDGSLLITVDPAHAPLAIYSVAFSALDNDRVLTLRETESRDDELAALLLPQVHGGAPQATGTNHARPRMAQR
ncbi:MAG: HAD family hydrolase [Pseudomonadota bacterium]